MLASVPLLAGGLLELPLGVLAGAGRRRRLAVLGGGIIFVLTLAGVASARSFAALLIAFIAFYPASGAFVSLTQAQLMDAWPDRHAQVMARWDLAGSTGAVAGPLLVTAVLASGGSWRGAYLALAGFAAVSWLGICLRGPKPAPTAAPGDADRADEAGDAAESRPWTTRAGEAIAALRDWDTVRWLILLEVADLLVDVFTGFLGVYLVDTVHMRPAIAALAIAIRLGAALAGDAALVLVLERTGDLAVLRSTAVAAALLYPGFLLVPGAVFKLVILAVLSAATAPWYPLLQARLYGSLPGRSPVAVTLSSAAGLAGGLGPLAVGLAAQALGLPWALAGLAVVPVVVLAISARARPGTAAGENTPPPAHRGHARPRADTPATHAERAALPLRRPPRRRAPRPPQPGATFLRRPPLARCASAGSTRSGPARHQARMSWQTTRVAALKLPGLPFPLEPAGSPPSGCRVRNGVLSLIAAASTDLFIDPAGTSLAQLPDAGRFAGLPPAGDFTLAAQVSVEFGSMYDAGVLLVHAGERHWAKLCFEYSPQSQPTAVTVVTRGTSDDCNSFEVDGSTLWMRITRSGAAWAFHASADGAWWRLLRYFALTEEAAALVRVGFMAQSPAGEGCAATFDHITFRPGAPEDLRDGS